MAIEENISNSGATVGVTENLQETTNASVAAEAVLPTVDNKIKKTVNVEEHHEQVVAKETQDALMGTGATFIGPHISTEGLGKSNVISFERKAKKTLEDQVIEARSKAAKGSAENGKKWGGLAQFIAGARKRFQHPQIETLPDNVTPINQAKSFGNAQQQEQITGPALIASAEQELPKAT